MQIKNKEQKLVRDLVFAAVCLALCMVLPLLTGQIREIGKALCPMHLPVLLCGFLCGPWWAMVVGFVAPLLRFALFSMPQLLPTGLAMCFELAAYGLFSGLLYGLLPKRQLSVYVTLVLSMILGRIVWGVASFLIYLAMGNAFSWAIFVAGAFYDAVPGILVQIVLIPVLVFALKKAKLIGEAT